MGADGLVAAAASWAPAPTSNPPGRAIPHCHISSKYPISVNIIPPQTHPLHDHVTIIRCMSAKVWLKTGCSRAQMKPEAVLGLVV